MGYVSNETMLVTIIGVIIILVIFILISIRSGSVPILELFNRLGFRVVSKIPEQDLKIFKKLNKNCIGVLYVPNICYVPVIQKNTSNIIGITERKPMDIHAVELKREDNSSLSLIRNESDKIFKDLDIIEGKSDSRTKNLLYARFTYLRKFIKEDFLEQNPIVTLTDEYGTRKFRFLMAVELEVGGRKLNEFKTREEFLNALSELSIIDTGVRTKRDILILNGKTSIDSFLVVLTECD